MFVLFVEKYKILELHYYFNRNYISTFIKMHRQVQGSGNVFVDEHNEYKVKKFHQEKVLRARMQGDLKLSQTMYDPQVFVLGTP